MNHLSFHLSPTRRLKEPDHRRMGSTTHIFRQVFPASSHHHRTQLTPAIRHHFRPLLLIVATFILTHFFDRIFSGSFPNYWCSISSQQQLISSSESDSFRSDGSIVSWPVRGYGIQLDLKIYVYDEDEIDGLKALMYGRDDNISPDSCVKGQWGTQVKIHRMFLKSRYRTKRKEEADLFFVPAYVKCVRTMGGLNDKEIDKTYVKVLSQMPYFRQSGGRNHIFVFPSGAGAHLFKSWATYLNRSIFLTPESDMVLVWPLHWMLINSLQVFLIHSNCQDLCVRITFGVNQQLRGDRTDKRDTSAFNTWKDIIIPGNVDDGMTNGSSFIRALHLSRRKYLANYLGRAQGKVGRLQLIELAKKYPDKLECPELKFSGPDKMGRKEYFEHLRNAKFCLAPRGESSWTLRFYESYFVECVPVILSDQVELPFQNVIDYTQMSIKWPSTHIGPELLDYLESIPDEAIEKMIEHGRRVKCIFVYTPESQPCSAINGIFWELQRKIRHFHQSTETFWLHNGSVVNRDLVRFSDWKPSIS